MKTRQSIFLRKAGFSDIEFLWYLRNQPDIYKYSRQNRVISWEEHINWIMPVILGLSLKGLFIILKQDTPIGQIRFDYLSQDEIEISTSILKEFRGQGFAKVAFEMGQKQIKKEINYKILTAVIHKENISSIKFFEKLKFKLKEEDKEWLKYIFYVL